MEGLLSTGPTPSSYITDTGMIALPSEQGSYNFDRMVPTKQKKNINLMLKLYYWIIIGSVPVGFEKWENCIRE